MAFIVTTNRSCDDFECHPGCRGRKVARRAVAIEVGMLRRWQIAADTTNVEPVKAEIIAAYNAKQEGGA